MDFTFGLIKKTKASEQSGQSLVEVIFAITVTVLILTGFVSAIIYFNRVSNSVKNRSFATDLAKQKIEQLRSQKEDITSTFWTDAASGAVNTESGLTVGKSTFTRTTTFSNYLTDTNNMKVKVTINISWTDYSSQPRNVEIASYFTNHRTATMNTPTP